NRAGIVERARPDQRGDAGKLQEEFAAATTKSGRQIALEVRKKHERCRRVEFLALKQHGRVWTEQQQRRHRPPAPRTRHGMAALAARRVRDLIVILEERDE